MTGSRLFDVDDETQAIADAAGKALAGVAPHRALTLGGEDAAAIARRHWAQAVELGWPGVILTEADGGLGLGLAEMAALVEEMGRHLFCGPFAASAVLMPSLARLAGGHTWAGCAGAVARGETIVSLAAPDGIDAWPGVEPLLSASCSLVEHPDLATHFLVLDLPATSGDALLLRAALVERAEAAGIATRQPFDATCPVAAVDFVRARIVPGTLLSLQLDQRACDAFLQPLRVAIAAELVGVAQGALDRALAHVRERQQFGAAIGSFQAIKHRLADTAMQVANARLAVRHAARPAADAIAALAARALATDAAQRTAGDCVQLQGGLGFSWESDAHLYLKRARRVAALLGSAVEARRDIAERYIASVPAAPADPA
jgi:alkylation response protein AidB-like acyl-CoA dehydrogenase